MDEPNDTTGAADVAFVIIDADAARLYLVRTNPPLVESITEGEINEIAGILEASALSSKSYSGLKNLVWTALVLSGGPRDDQTLDEFVRRAEESRGRPMSVALRYYGDASSLLLTSRKTRK